MARRMEARPARMTDRTRAGLALGVGAYGLWGLLPIYFKLLLGVPAVAIVAHRIIWSLFLLGGLLTVRRAWGEIGAALRHRGTMKLLLATALLIAVNWLVYVYAVNSGHILAGSLGYYLNPLANILLGRFVLREPLSRMQWLAVAIAAAGVSVLAVGALSHLWISLTLCLSFALYGLLRKIAHVDATAGLAIETALLFLPALLWLAWATPSMPQVWGLDDADLVLLVASGVASTIPLLLFTAAARRLRYSTLGILQFIAPTLQFLVAVFLYGEPFTTAHALAFACIWTAALLYLFSALKGGGSSSETLPE
jgi:chloramphenicol-sensitive protein RarD